MKKKKNLEYYETKKYKITMDFIVILGIILSIISIYISLLVRKDTAELSKFSDKPLYYTISLYPNENTTKSEVKDKYLTIDLTLVVDDFKINNKNFLDVNYNAVFTKIKYYMVYDYNLDNDTYKYMNYSLDDKAEASLRFEDNYEAIPVKLNYSFTPNKEYCYILIYTETTSEKNLDLLFFNYYDNSETFTLDTITENEKVRIDTKRIDYDAFICKEYFIDIWATQEQQKEEDLNFMFDVYNDLRAKLIY